MVMNGNIYGSRIIGLFSDVEVIVVTAIVATLRGGVGGWRYYRGRGGGNEWRCDIA